MTMHAKLKDPKKFETPAPNTYEVYKCTNIQLFNLSVTCCIPQAIIPEEQPSFAFGVKHSPYLYSGKQGNGDRWVTPKTEAVKQTEEEFRPRCGTFTRDKPTVLRSTEASRHYLE